MELFVEIINLFGDKYGFETVLTAFGAVFAVAKFVTIFTNSTNDDKVINALLKAFNLAALNVGKDRNADDVKKENDNA